ncbi:MAG: O-methyltransferase, partial [Pseudomonadota bacterium]|nr:O-methyltransferase [Pseudomonadota bacterium]
MSGECIYYSLRPNKFVERYLFVELLQKSIRDFSSDDYVYVSLGGPQLEDHHLINCKLGIKNLLSLEKSHSIITRQEYNKRRADIKCNEIDASEFINNFSTHISCYSGKKFIIWLDFSSPNERYEQLSELEALLKNYTFGDVVKITMNANARTLGIHKEGWSTDDLYRHRREKVQQQLGEYLPSLGVEKINKDTFPIILSQAIKNAALRGLDNTLNETVLPLGIFLYNDGNHQMITVTMIVINLDDVDNYRDWLGTNGW